MSVDRYANPSNRSFQHPLDHTVLGFVDGFFTTFELVISALSLSLPAGSVILRTSCSWTPRYPKAHPGLYVCIPRNTDPDSALAHLLWACSIRVRSRVSRLAVARQRMVGWTHRSHTQFSCLPNQYLDRRNSQSATRATGGGPIDRTQFPTGLSKNFVPTGVTRILACAR